MRERYDGKFSFKVYNIASASGVLLEHCSRTPTMDDSGIVPFGPDIPPLVRTYKSWCPVCGARTLGTKDKHDRYVLCWNERCAWISANMKGLTVGSNSCMYVPSAL